MIKVSKDTTKRLLAIHGWSGMVLGLALYVVVLTGAVVVFGHEIGHWSVSGATVNQPLLTNKLDGVLREAAATVPDEHKEEVSIVTNAANQLVVFFHTHVKNESGVVEEKGTRFLIDPKTNQIIEREEGFESELSHDAASALDHFLTTLHINLHAPDPWGLYLTGILGLVLLVAGVSGFILHRHFIKDMFLSPRLSNPLLNARDRHNLAGTWSLPFSVLLAFTGAFFSFASSIGFPVIAMTAFGGDQVKAVETLVGAPEAEDPTPATLANLDAIFQQSSQKAGSPITFVAISHWGRADATVSLFHEPEAQSMSIAQMVFDGPTGQFEQVKPRLGTQPSTGNTVVNLMSGLHFGNFSGLLSRIIWLSMGLAMCYVTITGMQLWIKRRADDPLWQGFHRWVLIVGYGTALAMIGSAIGFFATFPSAQTPDWTANGFLIVSALSIVVGYAVRSLERLNQTYQWLLAVGLVSLPLLRMGFGGDGWPNLLGNNHTGVVAMDINLLIAGVLTALFAQGIRLPDHSNKPAQTNTPLVTGGA